MTRPKRNALIATGRLIGLVRHATSAAEEVAVGLVDQLGADLVVAAASDIRGTRWSAATTPAVVADWLSWQAERIRDQEAIPVELPELTDTADRILRVRTVTGATQASAADLIRELTASIVSAAGSDVRATRWQPDATPGEVANWLADRVRDHR